MRVWSDNVALVTPNTILSAIYDDLLLARSVRNEGSYSTLYRCAASAKEILPTLALATLNYHE